MSLSMELWQLLSLLLGFLGALVGLAKVLLAQIDKRLDARFAAMELARQESTRHWDERFGSVLNQQQREAENWQRLERDFLRFQADLPVAYVRREDYIRGQSVIEAKLDALYNKLEVVQMKGGPRD